MPYIVTINRPYYPDIYHCETLELAEELQNDIVNEEGSKDHDSKYDVEVIVAKVHSIKNIKTDY